MGVRHIGGRLNTLKMVFARMEHCSCMIVVHISGILLVTVNANSSSVQCTVEFHRETAVCQQTNKQHGNAFNKLFKQVIHSVHNQISDSDEQAVCGIKNVESAYFSHLCRPLSVPFPICSSGNLIAT